MTALINIPAPAGTHTVYTSVWSASEIELTLGVRDENNNFIVAVLLDENGNVMEWFTEESWFETVANFAPNYKYMVYLDVSDDPDVQEVIGVALKERRLAVDNWYNDVPSTEMMPESWTTGTDPKFTSRLAI